MEKTEKKANQLWIKVLAVLAVCVMLLVGVSLLHTSDSAIAVETAAQTITVSNVTVNRGAEFDVDITIGNNSTGIQSITLDVTFDPSVMTLLEVTPKVPETAVETETWTSDFMASGKDKPAETYDSYGAKPFRLMWATSDVWRGEGVIATLRFLAKPSAEAKDYQITVTADPDNTLVPNGQKRDLNISGGAVSMLPGKYGLYLYDAYGGWWTKWESNAAMVSIETVLEVNKGGLTPTKEATDEFKYEFRGWMETDPVDGHATFMPIYTETPIDYDITFKVGVKPDGESVIGYSGAHTSEKTVTLPYGKIINYDAEVPARYDETYSFHGWYKDEACTIPVDYVVMSVPEDKDQGWTVYGYFGVNVDDPSVTSTTLTLSTTFETEGADEYVIATISLTENFGINSLLFAPTFDSTKLEFIGFYYDSHSTLYGAFAPTFPPINAATKAGQNVADAWQLIDAQETIEDKHFLFMNTYENVLLRENVIAKGELLKLKFKIKSGVALDNSEIGVEIGSRDATRYDAKDGIYYANVVVNEAKVNVIRVTAPTPYTAEEKTYTYTYDHQAGKAVNAEYVFKNYGDYEYDEDKYYYTLSGHDVNAVVGNYTATAKLNAIDGARVTWTDGTTADKTFDYEIVRYKVTKPVSKGDTYTYNGSTKYFVFTEDSKVDSAYYTISGDEQTNAGNYNVTVSLKDKENTEWADDNDTVDTDNLSIPFIINRLKVVKPTASTAEYRFNPGAQVPYEYNNDGVAITYTFDAEDAASKNYYTVSDSRVQTLPRESAYTVTVSLVDKENTEWADNDDKVDTVDLAYDFVIGKYQIATPVVQPKAFTGAPVLADVVLPVNSPFDVSQEAHTQPDIYDVVFTIKDDYKSKYEWKTPDEEDPLSTTAKFEITGGLINEWTTAPYVNGKTYDGTPVVPGGVSKYGTPVVLYRLQSGTDEDFSSTPPVNAGVYYAKFSVPAGENDSYGELNYDLVPFEISKGLLTKPTPFTEEENSYTYSGSPIPYVFKQAGSADKYDLSGNVETDAGSYTVSVAIKDEYKANYVWSDGTNAALSFTFVIKKAQLTIPVAEDREYVYNGEEQTFVFSVVEYSDRYTIINNKYKDAGVHTVIAKIENAKKANYEWADGTTSDKTYDFKIRFASLSATTDSGVDEVTVKVSSEAGLDATSTFAVQKKAEAASEILAAIRDAAKKGALGQMTDEAAAALVIDKCVVASLRLQLTPAAAVGEYLTEITLSAARTGVVVIRFVGDDAEVFSVRQTGEKTFAFDADGVSDYVILADHAFEEVADAAYLVSAATCEEAAVYHKSCACGVVSEETFSYGEPLGHTYDFANVIWIWSADHLSAIAKVVCSRDANHVLTFEGEDVTITVLERVAPALDSNGRVVRRASFAYYGDTYTSTDTETLFAGHVFSDPVTPEWTKSVTPTGYAYKATFVCDCGEYVVTLDATVTMEETSEKLIYKAQVTFQGRDYEIVEEVEHPLVRFRFGEGDEISSLLLPGDTVPFVDETGHEREGYLFIGWRNEAGTLIVNDDEGKFFDYKIGFEQLIFTAVWKKLTTVSVSVTDPDGEAIEGAIVSIYETDNVVLDVNNEIVPKAVLATGANGEAFFQSVPYGNYKLVVTFPYTEEVDIVRSSYLDVDEAEGERVTIVLPRTRFNTVLDGIGSVEGLDGAISEEDKNQITDGTSSGTINEIVITQKRVAGVSDEIKEQITQEVGRDSTYKNGQLVEFYEITMMKETTIRNANGDQYRIYDNIKETVNYQTNIFPLSTALKQKIVEVGGTVDNVFVYKRHTYAPGEVVIYNIPKLDEATGSTAEMECFFIKRVAGEEYIAIRQKEYSEIAFGVSPDPILNLNEITRLYLPDRTYGDATEMIPVVRARYGENTAVITYSATENGEYTAEMPTKAGTYYMKAYIPANVKSGYGAAERVYTFTIYKKVVTRPVGDAETKFVYNGEDQTYRIEANADYAVTGNVQKDAGTYVVKVALVDIENTIWDSGLIGDLSFDFVIEKKKLADLGGITFEDKNFWFNGKRHSIEISGELPEGVEVVYDGNDESELGRFTVTAIFKSVNPNYDVSEPMTAVMRIRLNWIPILILIIIALAIIVVVIVIVEKLLKKERKGENPPPNAGGGGSENEQQNGTEEGTNND